MAKTKISEFSSTPSNNTDIDSINIAEGCAPSGINDAIRELMAQLKDWQSGTSNDPYVVGSSGSLTLNQGTANGIPYLNGSKVVTSGSALTFDGSTLATTGALTVDGNTTLGNASTDTVTVNGYMGIGGGATSSRAIQVLSSALTGTTQIGILSQPTANSSATAALRSISSYPVVENSTFTIPLVAAFYASVGSKGASATATNWHGIYIDDQTQGTNNYGITSLVSSGTNKWNIYASGTAANYFAGNVGIGNSNPTARLEVVTSSGTATAKIWSATNTTPIADLELQRGTNATWGADAYGDYRIRNDSGALLFQYGESGTTTERMRIDSSGNVGIGTNAPSNYNVLGGAFTAIAGSGISNLSIVSGASSTGNILFADGTTGDERRAGRIAYDHSVNNLYFFTNGNSLRATIDSSGNLGLGVTPSASWSGQKALQIGSYSAVSSSDSAGTGVSSNAVMTSAGFGAVYSSSNRALLYQQNYNTGVHAWYNSASGTAGNAITWTQAMTLDASGQLAIGRTSAVSMLDIERGTAATNTTAGILTLRTASSGTAAAGLGSYINFLTENSNGTQYETAYIGAATESSTAADKDGYIFFSTALNSSNPTERARIDSSGNLLVGTTSQYGGEKLNITQSAASAGLIARLSSGPYNNTSYAIVQGVDGTTTRFYFPSNGGLYNYSANNVNLSDERTKTQIQNAGSYLAKICAIPVRTFKYKDQTDDLLNLGVIAQEVEAIAPELVNFDGFGDDIPEDGVPLKGIYQTDLQYALMKCIQEQQAIITALTARVEALESN